MSTTTPESLPCEIVPISTDKMFIANLETLLRTSTNELSFTTIFHVAFTTTLIFSTSQSEKGLPELQDMRFTGVGFIAKLVTPTLTESFDVCNWRRMLW